jgi:hypothetical protein
MRGTTPAHSPVSGRAITSSPERRVTLGAGSLSQPSYYFLWITIEPPPIA